MSPNEPAFPSDFGPNDKYEGMTLRAYFAGQVIGALIASDGFEKRMLSETELPLEELPRFSAQLAAECADALIAELNKPQ